MPILCILRRNSHKLIANISLENICFYSYESIICNSEHLGGFASLVMHDVKHCISILTDFMTSQKSHVTQNLRDILHMIKHISHYMCMHFG